jgi:Ras-related GTP-binding protein C/D
LDLFGYSILNCLQEWQVFNIQCSLSQTSTQRNFVLGNDNSNQERIHAVSDLSQSQTYPISNDLLFSSFMDFQVWDFPGHLDYRDDNLFDSKSIFGEIGALIWVIDAQDELFDAIQQLNATILYVQEHYPKINVEVFVHKVDGLSDDYRSDTFQTIQQHVQDELDDNGFQNAPVYFHQTSIYDHTIFEAFSRVIQKLIPELGTLESLLTTLCANCKIEKAYLFDVLSKIYIATDTSPTEISSYEICSDYIDVVVDISEIYGWDRQDLDTNDPVEMEEEEFGNQDAESLIIMERKNGNYLYLKEINKYVTKSLWSSLIYTIG